MIVNGASRSSIGFWVKHLENDKKNNRAELREIRGLAAQDLREALNEMKLDAQFTKATNFFYQANFNPEERLTEEQWERAFELFEKHRGIPEGQPRVVFEHEKHGRIHRHVIWSRVIADTQKVWRDALDAKVCHAAAREISEELGLSRVVSPLDKDRDGPRPDRAPEPYEMFRGQKSGLDPRDIKMEVTRLYRESQNATEFIEVLETHGYQLIRGDRRGFCILDCSGDVHSLPKRLEGVNTKELRSFMTGVELSSLPTVEQAKQGHRARVNAERVEELSSVQKEIAWEEALAKAGIEKEKVEKRFVEPAPEKEKTAGGREKDQVKELRGMSAKLETLLKHSDSEEAFKAALKDRNIGLAIVTKGEADKSHREAAFARELGNFSPRFKEGEIVAITAAYIDHKGEKKDARPLNRLHRLDQKFANDLVDRLIPAKRESILGIEDMKTAVDQRAAIKRGDWIQQKRAERAMSGKYKEPKNSKQGLRKTISAASAGARSFGKTLDIVADALDSLFSPKITPRQKMDNDIAVERRAEEATDHVETEKYTVANTQFREREDEFRRDAQREDRGRDR